MTAISVVLLDRGPLKSDTPFLSMVRLGPGAAPCLVEPLPPIVDPAAIAFETGMRSSGTVDTADLTSPTARALLRFEKVIMSTGGTLTITSAYRPPAYQRHLQQVWDKWVYELRDNRQPACGQLRAQVLREFTRHQLLETQRPVDSSDHTRGIAFDAAVTLPPVLAKHRLRLSLDRLARLCRLRRPDVLHDPVHFRFALAPRRSRTA